MNKEGTTGLSDPQNGDFAISEASPARNSAIDLTAYNLPGVDEFFRNTKDCGAVGH